MTTRCAQTRKPTAMSKTPLDVKVSFAVIDCNDLPTEDGKQMYTDDVEAEVRAVIETALGDWFRRRGHTLVSYEPLVV